jgi:hypothetical protein
MVKFVNNVFYLVGEHPFQITGPGDEFEKYIKI